ncbi:hypothetical protein ACE1ET_10240 [Saccharicrinis sp. FJH62]|uniref:hypothetical protein n=1 Tax=Saccharicrinis sp. FJH62 TaxID=3344657 RepID=UPI0035D52B9E
MKHQFYLFALIIILPIVNSCSTQGTSDYISFDDVVVDDPDSPNKFRQITFVISLKDEENGYLNLERIDSVKLFVDARYWGCFSSELHDTTGLTSQVINDLSYSDKKIDYLVVAPYDYSPDELETAGQFVQYLKDRIVLTPGAYVCEINKIKYSNHNKEFLDRKVQVFSDFTVVENATSSYVGDIEIIVNP